MNKGKLKISVNELLNWEPVSEPVYDNTGCVGLKSIRRNDTGDLLGVVGIKRAIVSNKESVESIIRLANELNCPFEPYSNQFNNGGKIHVNFPLPEEKIKGDSMTPEIRFTFSHDSSERRRVYYVMSRNACTNVFAAGLKTGESIFAKYSINHESNFANRVSGFAPKIKELHFKVEESIEYLQSVRVSSVDRYLKKLVKGEGTRSENIRGEIETLFRNGRGNKGETLYDLFNGYTEYLNHSATYKTTESKSEDENKLSRLVNFDLFDFQKTLAAV
jgi:hypothetical protein